MIDLHCHVLPCLDDGAESPEEALEMLRMAAAAGTTDIAATPHANERYWFEPAEVEQKLAELRAAAGDVPRLHYGCEMHLTPENVADVMRTPASYTLNHRGYLLLEFSDFQIPGNITAIFRQMMDAGLRIIVVHPERNPLLQTSYDRLHEWAEQGCIFQVTAESFFGRFGKSASESSAELMKRGLVHVVASDGHRVRHRPPVLDEAHRHVVETYGAEVAQRLFTDNPRCVLEGKALPRPGKRRWLAGIWGRG